MDRLLHLMMLSKTKLLQIENIGTFLHHAIIDASLTGEKVYTESIIQNLSNLFTLNQTDLLLTMKILGVSDFRNVQLLQSYELQNGNVNLTGMKDCYEKLTMKVEKEQIFKKVKSKSPFSSLSPCSNLSSYPECYTYCQWQMDAFDDLSTSQIRDLQRYLNVFLKQKKMQIILIIFLIIKICNS